MTNPHYTGCLSALSLAVFLWVFFFFPFIVSYLCKHMSHTWQHILLLGLLRMNRKLGRGTDVRWNKGSRFVRTKLLISNVAWLHIKSVEIYVPTQTDAEKKRKRKKNVMFSKKLALIPKLLLDTGQMYSVLIPPQASLRSLPLFVFFPFWLRSFMFMHHRQNYSCQEELWMMHTSHSCTCTHLLATLMWKRALGGRGGGWGHNVRNIHFLPTETRTHTKGTLCNLWPHIKRRRRRVVSRRYKHDKQRYITSLSDVHTHLHQISWPQTGNAID